MGSKFAAQQQIVRNLELAISRVQADMRMVEFWTAALDGFSQPVPGYEPDARFMLTPHQASEKSH